MKGRAESILLVRLVFGEDFASAGNADKLHGSKIRFLKSAGKMPGAPGGAKAERGKRKAELGRKPLLQFLSVKDGDLFGDGDEAPFCVLGTALAGGGGGDEVGSWRLVGVVRRVICTGVAVAEIPLDVSSIRLTGKLHGLP